MRLESKSLTQYIPYLFRVTLLRTISHLLCRHVDNETFLHTVPSGAICPSSPQGDQHRIYSENSHNGGDVFEDESGISRDDV